MKDGTPKRIKAPLVAVAAIVLLAALVELGYSALARGGELSLQSVGATAFESWEFEDRGGNSYYALANNSWFKVDGLGGGPADRIQVLMTREAGDATESVLYYSASVGGVKGDFIAPVAKDADGTYSAYIDADELYGVKLYPTEKVRTVITFEGIIVNPDAASGGFSLSRVILWGFIVAAIYLLYKWVCFGIKKSGKPSAWLTAYAALTALALTAVFAATRMFTALHGKEGLLLPIAAAGVTAVFALIYAVAEKIKKIEWKLFAAVLAAGAAFCFVTAPLQAPDEYSHFLRSYAIAQGRLDFDYNEEFPNDVDLLVDRFPGSLNLIVQSNDDDSVLSRIQGYLGDVENGAVGKGRPTSMQLVLPYVPAATGIAIARLFSANALVCLYAARLMNAAVYALCAYLALKCARRYRAAVIAAALLPLALFMAGSTSYDSWFLSMTLLFTGLCLKDDFSNKDLLLAALALAGAVFVKPIYAPLALLLFLVPKEQYKAGIKRGWAFAALVAAGMLFYWGSMIYAGAFAVNIPSTEYLEGVNISAQIKYVLGHPLRYIMVMLVDGWENVFYLEGFGTFGWLDVEAGLTRLLTPTAIVVAAALGAPPAKKDKKTDALVFSAVTLVVYALVVTGFYATWSTLGSTSILGVQTRYFIPLVIPVAGLVSRAFARFVSSEKTPEQLELRCLAVFAALAATGALECLAKYYLM